MSRKFKLVLLGVAILVMASGCSLSINSKVNIDHELLNALSAGNFEWVKECVEGGANINAVR